mmetsp:Transcript_44753/g.57323  ORF Transcript_44753/g.57323 Transcript_44753/m.57323 type:complete len:498 (+) Transcript_44753:77-1570(+)
MSLTSAIGYLSGFNGVVKSTYDDLSAAHSDQIQHSEVTFHERGTLGIKLALKKRGEDNSKVVVVDLPRNPETGEMGVVELSGKVIIGDELLMVNKESVPVDDFPGTVLLLKNSVWPLTLKFRRHKKTVLTEKEIENLLSEKSEVGDQRRLRMLEAIRSSGAGPLLLQTIQYRSSIQSQNRQLIQKSKDLDLPLKHASDVVQARMRGSKFLVSELNELPGLKTKIKDMSKQVVAIGASIDRIEELLAQREARRAASNPFTLVVSQDNQNNAEINNETNDQFSDNSPFTSPVTSPRKPFSNVSSPITSPVRRNKQEFISSPADSQTSSRSSSPLSTTSSSISSDSTSLSSDSESFDEDGGQGVDIHEMSPVDALNLSLQVVDDLLDRRRSASLLADAENTLSHQFEEEDQQHDYGEPTSPRLSMGGEAAEEVEEGVSSPHMMGSPRRIPDNPLITKETDTGGSDCGNDVGGETTSADDVNDALRALLGDDFKTVIKESH